MAVRARARRRTPAPLTGPLEHLGERLRKARTEAGLSQAQLGDPHFTRAYVSALELGKIRPSMKSLEFLAAKLGKPTAYFLADEEAERKRQERELTLARATQLIAEGSARTAVDELLSIDAENLPFTDRLVVKRTLGRAYLEAGDAARAAVALSEALRGYESLQDAENAARVHGQLGGALIGTSSYAEAEEHLETALRATVSGPVRDPLFRVHVLHNLGVALYQRADYRAALGHFERAAREGADIADQKWLASLYAAMGMSRRQVGDYEGAITCLRKSEALFDAIHNKSRVAEIRFQAARTLKAIGSRAKAEEMMMEALAAAEAAGNEPLAVRIGAFRGLSAAQDGEYAAARQILEPLVARADATGNSQARFAARFALAKTLTNVDPQGATVMLRTLATELEGAGALDELAQVYDELGKALARQGLSEESVLYAQRAYTTSLKAKKGGI